MPASSLGDVVGTECLTSEEPIRAARRWLDEVGLVSSHSWEEDIDTGVVHAYKERRLAGASIPYPNVSLCGNAERSSFGRRVRTGGPGAMRCEACGDIDAANLASLLFSREKSLRCAIQLLTTALVRARDCIAMSGSVDRANAVIVADGVVACIDLALSQTGHLESERKRRADGDSRQVVGVMTLRAPAPDVASLDCPHCFGSGCEPRVSGEVTVRSDGVPPVFDGDPCTVCRPVRDMP
jgi:hypothetical protein